MCLFVCLSVCCHSPHKLLDGSYPQTWHGPPPGPWECPTHTFLGGTLTRGGIILEKLKMLETFPYCSENNNLIIQIQIYII